MKEQAGRAGRVTPSQPSGEFNFVQVFSAAKHIPIAGPPALSEHGLFSAPNLESLWHSQRCVVMDFTVVGGRGWTPVWEGLLKRRESDDNFRGMYKMRSVVQLVLQSTGALWNQRQ